MDAERLSKIIYNFELFAKNFLVIRTKAGKKKRFLFNRAQKYVLSRLEDQLKKTGRVRTLILKGRQQGVSTLIQARFFWKVITHPGTQAYILTHEAEATKNLFNMAIRYYNNLPYGLCPKADKSSAKELSFRDFDSGYSVGTAGNKGAGRSQTIQLFHGSEFGYWPHADEHSKGVMQAVPGEKGTEMILESTANGIGNEFHSMWQAAQTGKNEYQNIFVPWYWQDEYKAPIEGIKFTEEEYDLYEMHHKNGLTGGHLAWRRIKIATTKDRATGLLRFRQEYPFTAQEAFLNPVDQVFMDSEVVFRAMKFNIDNPVGRLKIGVDPAIGTNDRLAIIRRKGRKAYGIETHYSMDTMEIVGRIVRIMKEENPYRVYIDMIGIGAGVVDRLHELGHSETVVGVNVATKAHERSRYSNRRAECWDNMKEWFNDEMGVDVPDSEELHADLCSLGYSFNSNDELKLESKDKLKARGIRSPDVGDALSLTFVDGVSEPYIPAERIIKIDQKRQDNLFR